MRSTRDGMLCPHRIIDDLGSGFALGTTLGSIWYYIKGSYYAPKRQKIFGGIDLIRKRAPLLGGNFATWMGLFGFFQCLLVHVTEKDTHMNQAVAGALTGGLINIRGGWRYAMRGAISGGIFIGVFNIFEIVMVKKQLQMENNMMQTQLRMSYIDQLEQVKVYNPREIKRIVNMY